MAETPGPMFTTYARTRPALEEAIDIRANELILKATGSRWTITSREHTKSRGQHPDLILYDESGWARDDELFASLLAGQSSVSDPLTLLTSTVGPRQSGPLWRVKALAESGDASVSGIGHPRTARLELHVTFSPDNGAS
jgi:hypothetical protein